MNIYYLRTWKYILIHSIFFIYSSSASSLIYTSIASFFHLSSSLMFSLEILLVAVEMTAFFLIEWPKIWIELISVYRSNSFILLIKYDLLNDSYKREKRKSMKEYEWYWNSIEKTLIEYKDIFNDEKCIFMSFQYWFIFDVESVKVIESLMLKNMCFLIIYDFQNDNDSQIFHVNSFDHRNLTNVIQSIILRLISFQLFYIYWMIFYKIFIMRDNLIYFSFSL